MQPWNWILTLPLVTPVSELFTESWSFPLGRGYSGVAADGTRVFASYRDAEGALTHVLALESTGGELAWRASFEDVQHAGQEDYGGGTGPHATPLVHDGRVFVLGYGGVLVAFDAESGDEEWKVDLVTELSAEPVQFGFAASPVAIGKRIFVMTGGESGVTAFDATNGSIEWRSAPRAASYVTPVLAEVSGQPQLVCLLQDETVGFDPQDGAELWSVAHARPGLTNYAMIAPVPGGGFVVSGQGNRGARRIDVERRDDRWRADVTWQVRGAQFSHGRVVVRDGFLYGCNGSMLCALELEGGTLAFKLRGFGESNLIDVGAFVVQANEDGELAALGLRPEGVDVLARHAGSRRAKAWAPPTLAAGQLFVRDDERLVAVRLPSGNEVPSPIETLDSGYRPGSLKLPPALLAFAHGAYETESGEVAQLIAKGGVLSIVLPDSSRPVELSPLSEDEFVAEDGGRLVLSRDEEIVPTAVLWQSGSTVLRARRKPLVAIELADGERDRVLGAWRIADAIDLDVRASEVGLVATSSAYEGVSFRVRAESAERLWLEALDAPYGIPPILIEVGRARIDVHQSSDTRTGVRP